MSKQLVTFPLFARVTVQLDFFLLLDWNDSKVYWEHVGLVIRDLAIFISFFRYILLLQAIYVSMLSSQMVFNQLNYILRLRCVKEIMSFDIFTNYLYHFVSYFLLTNN